MRFMAINVSILRDLRSRTESLFHGVRDDDDIRPSLLAAERGHALVRRSIYHPVVCRLAPPGCTLRSARLPLAYGIQWSVDMTTGAAAVASALLCCGLGQRGLAMAYIDHHAMHVCLFVGVMGYAVLAGAVVGCWAYALPILLA